MFSQKKFFLGSWKVEVLYSSRKKVKKGFICKGYGNNTLPATPSERSFFFQRAFLRRRFLSHLQH